MKGTREFAVMAIRHGWDDIEGSYSDDPKYNSDRAYNWYEHACMELRLFIIEMLEFWIEAGYSVTYNGSDYLRIRNEYCAVEYIVKSRYYQ